MRKTGNISLTISRDVFSVAVDCCIRFTRKIQHGGDWEWSRPQGQNNVHNFLMIVRKMSWACDIVAEMLLIQKTWLFEDKSKIWAPKEMSHNIICVQCVTETYFNHCLRSIPCWSHHNNTMKEMHSLKYRQTIHYAQQQIRRHCFVAGLQCGIE